MMGARLELRGLCKRFGALEVLRGVDLVLEPGERHWITGHNGAGKSTLLDLISGNLRADDGSISLDGRAVDRVPAHRRADLGIARNWQLPQVFSHQAVGVQLAAALRVRAGRRYGLGRPAVDQGAITSLAAQFELDVRLDAMPDELAYAQRRMLDLALVFAAPARLILLDEPSAGLSRHDARRLYARLAGWTGAATVLIVEHDHRLAADFASGMSALVHGVLMRADGEPGNALKGRCADA